MRPIRVLSVLLPVGLVVALAACAPGGGGDPFACLVPDPADPVELTAPAARNDCLSDGEDEDVFDVTVPENSGTVTVTCSGSENVSWDSSDGGGDGQGDCDGDPVTFKKNNNDDLVVLTFFTQADVTDETYGFTVSYLEDL